MRRHFAAFVWIAGGMALSACLYSRPLVLGPSTVATAAQTARRTTLPTVEPITPTAAPMVLDPEAKPKGYIVFEKGVYGGDGFYLVEPDASGPGVLTPLSVGGYYPTWSPAGDSIAYAVMHCAPVEEYPGGVEKTTDVPSHFLVDDIVVVNGEGKEFRKLTSMGAGDRLWDFAWSPDGRWIAMVHTFEVLMSGGAGYMEPSVYVAKTDGSGLVKKIGDALDMGEHIEWFPDSRRLGFLVPGGLFVSASIETGVTESIVSINPPHWARGDIFDISSDGAFLVYIIQTSTEYSIYRIGLEGGEEGVEPESTVLFRETFEPSEKFLPRAGALALSPDGSRLLYVVTEGGQATLRLLTISGGDPVILATLSDCASEAESIQPGETMVCWSPNWRPAWSSDGQWILYATATSGQGWESGNIYIVNAAQALSGSAQPVLQAENGRDPSWQPVN